MLENDMIEPIRIASNVFIFIWLGIVVFGWLNHNPWRVASLLVGVYLLLKRCVPRHRGIHQPRQWWSV